MSFEGTVAGAITGLLIVICVLLAVIAARLR